MAGPRSVRTQARGMLVGGAARAQGLGKRHVQGAAGGGGGAGGRGVNQHGGGPRLGTRAGASGAGRRPPPAPQRPPGGQRPACRGSARPDLDGHPHHRPRPPALFPTPNPPSTLPQALLAAAALVALAAPAAAISCDASKNSPVSSSFIKTAGTRFTLDGQPWYFGGTNAVFLMNSDGFQASEIPDFFCIQANQGARVVRVAAYLNGYGCNMCTKTPQPIQPKVMEGRLGWRVEGAAAWGAVGPAVHAPARPLPPTTSPPPCPVSLIFQVGEYNEFVLQRLDKVVAEAKKNGGLGGREEGEGGGRAGGEGAAGRASDAPCPHHSPTPNNLFRRPPHHDAGQL